MQMLPFAVSVLLTVIAVVSFVAFSRSAEPWRKVPILLEVSLALLLLALAVWPEAVPSLFQSLLGHSIHSQYTYPPTSSGVRITETWVAARWWVPIGMTFSGVVLVGIVWAFINLLMGRQRIANAMAFCLGIFWLGLAAVANLRCLPFCV